MSPEKQWSAGYKKSVGICEKDNPETEPEPSAPPGERLAALGFGFPHEFIPFNRGRDSNTIALRGSAIHSHDLAHASDPHGAAFGDLSRQRENKIKRSAHFKVRFIFKVDTAGTDVPGLDDLASLAASLLHQLEVNAIGNRCARLLSLTFIGTSLTY